MDYEQYIFSKKEKVRYGLEVVLLGGIVSYLFYHSAYAMILCLPIGIFYFKEKKKELIQKRKQLLNEQFKEAILAVSTALKVGYSIENAFVEALKDLKLNFPKEADIVKEFTTIKLQLKNNIVLEKLLMDFAKRSHIDDIADFTEVFIIAKRRGGDFEKIIQNTVSVISDKIEVKQEIETMLTAKRYEQKIMNIVPMLIILYISLTSPHFFDVLYHNLFGVCFMSCCLLVYVSAIYMSQRICEIEV